MKGSKFLSNTSNWLWLIPIPFVLSPWSSSASALLLGMVLVNLNLAPGQVDLAAWAKKLLAISVVGLGFGVSLEQAIKYTSDSVGLIIGSIVFTLGFGYLLTRLLKLELKLGYLISCGTAICGGSAIAAISPAIKANAKQITLALAVVLLLNALSLFVFPVIGHSLSLSQAELGIWAAIAIHDTSSVVGAAASYGQEALAIATTVKLTRALWIIPLVLISGLLFNTPGGKKKLPWFILFYIAAVVISNLYPQAKLLYGYVFEMAQSSLRLCLYFLGFSLSAGLLRQAGVKPLVLGVSLWISVSSLSLLWIVFLG